jgi:heterodisulfide reductase subunit C
MLDTPARCVSCKGCRHECPTGVDMTKMKIQVLNTANKRRRLPMHERMIAYLPHYAPAIARFSGVLNLAQKLPGFELAA